MDAVRIIRYNFDLAHFIRSPTSIILVRHKATCRGHGQDLATLRADQVIFAARLLLVLRPFSQVVQWQDLDIFSRFVHLHAWMLLRNSLIFHLVLIY